MLQLHDVYCQPSAKTIAYMNQILILIYLAVFIWNRLPYYLITWLRMPPYIRLNSVELCMMSNPGHLGSGRPKYTCMIVWVWDKAELRVAAKQLSFYFAKPWFNPGFLTWSEHATFIILIKCKTGLSTWHWHPARADHVHNVHKLFDNVSLRGQQ